MAQFTPEDGVVYFAWRNTFHRVNERTYDWVYCREEVMDGGVYLAQEIPFSDAVGIIDWVRLIHERTFDTPDKVIRFVSALQRRYEAQFKLTPRPMAVKVAEAKHVGSATMFYDNGTLVLPSPSVADEHEDPSADPIVRAQFLASRWTDEQRHWPIAEHHVLHELAHHLYGSADHESGFVETFRRLLEIASSKKNFSPVIWDFEIAIAERLFIEGEQAVDLVTGNAFGPYDWSDRAALLVGH